MYLTIPRILRPAQVSEIVAGLEKLNFIDGRLSAEGLAYDAKENSIAEGNRESRRIGSLVKACLLQSPQFLAFAIPKQMVDLEFAKYTVGMRYGEHCDAALFSPHSPNSVRTDLSVTIFLSPSHEYDGGELVIKNWDQEFRLKGEAGDALVYPSSYLHEVTEVTRGTRMVAVSWIQSHVRLSECRAILYDLSTISARNAELESPDVSSQLLLTRAYNSLVRLWSEA